MYVKNILKCIHTYEQLIHTAICDSTGKYIMSKKYFKCLAGIEKPVKIYQMYLCTHAHTRTFNELYTL